MSSAGEANLDELSPEERKAHEERKAWVAALKRECLKSPEELPDLPEEELTLRWGLVTRGTGHCNVIRFGKREIWREPACWESYDRFAEILAILRDKYGDRLVDVVPSSQSEWYLYGDAMSAPEDVKKARMRLRTGPPPRGPGHRGKKKAAPQTPQDPGTADERLKVRTAKTDETSDTGGVTLALLASGPDGKPDEKEVDLFMKQLGFGDGGP